MVVYLTRGEFEVKTLIKQYISEHDKMPFKKELCRMTRYTEGVFYDIMSRMKQKGVVIEEKIGAKTYVKLN